MRRGVSLGDVFACVFVFAVFLAVLWPVLAVFWPMHTDSGRRPQCISNAKQVALAMELYVNDSDEVLPPARRRDGVFWPSLLMPYVHSASLWTCPADKGAINSFGLNEMVFVDLADYSAAPPVSPSMKSIPSPATTVMFSEVGTGDDLITDRKNAYKLTPPDGRLHDEYDARPAARHKERCSVAFLDGHASLKRLDQFYTGQTPADRWFCRDASQAKKCVSVR